MKFSVRGTHEGPPEVPAHSDAVPPGLYLLPVNTSLTHIRNTVHKDPLQVAELIQLPRGLGMGDLTLTGGRQTGGSGTTLL